MGFLPLPLTLVVCVCVCVCVCMQIWSLEGLITCHVTSRRDTQFKTTMNEGGCSDMIATISVLQLNGSMNKATQVMMRTQGS